RGGAGVRASRLRRRRYHARHQAQGEARRPGRLGVATRGADAPARWPAPRRAITREHARLRSCVEGELAPPVRARVAHGRRKMALSARFRLIISPPFSIEKE